MNYSACVIPVTTASKDIDAFDESYEPLNDVNRKNWEACECNFIVIAVCLILRTLQRNPLHYTSSTATFTSMHCAVPSAAYVVFL